MVLLVLFIVLTSLTLFGLIFSIVKYRPLKTDNPNVNRHLKDQIQQIEEDKNLKRMEDLKGLHKLSSCFYQLLQ